MKIIYLAYRDWAKRVYHTIKKHPKVTHSVLLESSQDLNEVSLGDYDLLISCGWSDELGEDVVSKIQCIGVHCAELDRYSYGSPLQLQIIDGLQRTKHRIFSFTHDSSSARAHTHNRLFSHEVDLDLSGGVAEIFEQMTSTSKALFNWFLDDYPDICWRPWPEESIIRSKRVPQDSRLFKKDLIKFTTLELYNFFRSLEDPYPNGYIEDEKGYLFIERVSYKSK